MNDGSIAYFSMEIALEAGMPTYSDGRDSQPDRSEVQPDVAMASGKKRAGGSYESYAVAY